MLPNKSILTGQKLVENIKIGVKQGFFLFAFHFRMRHFFVIFSTQLAKENNKKRSAVTLQDIDGDRAASWLFCVIW